MASKLGRWLGTLTQDQLAEVLTRRPDALVPPVPRTLGELADRLQSRASVSAAFHGLPQPAVELVELMQACGGPTVARGHLAAVVGRTPDDPDLDAALRVLSLRALVWLDGDDLRMVGPLWSAFAYPLHLGPPAERLFSARNADELRRIAAVLGVPVGRNKQQAIKDLVAALTEGERVRAAITAAPEEFRQVLHEVAWHGPVVRSPEIIYGYGHSPDPVLDWALSRGLLVADGWQAAVMPGEVGLALRGPGWTAPFTPQPPVPPLTTVDAPALAREAAAAAGNAVSQVTALLESCAIAPVARLKAGGVGTRELRRLAKAIGTDESAARLWLELAYGAGLVGMADEAVLPTEAYDEWREREPAGRLVPLIEAWWRLPVAPLAGSSLAAGPALTRTAFGDAVRDLRHELLRAAAGLPAGQGLAPDGDLAPVVTWRAPLLAGALDGAADLLAAGWSEARLLGLVGHGALTPLGSCLVRGGDALLGVARELLPAAVDTVLLQADLTAVVPGTPNAALASLLDSAADRESRGGASIWRFSPGSVRRALDGGLAAGQLRSALASVAVGGELPQPLDYLIGDVARRHGQIRVRTVACVLRSDDPALLTEIVAVRSLGSLGLVALAPTVVASRKPAAETLAALRAAGYGPVGESADGAVVVERAERRRASSKRRPLAAVPEAWRPRAAAPGGAPGGASGRTGATAPGGASGRAGAAAGRAAQAVDPAKVAAALLAGPMPADEPPPPVARPARRTRPVELYDPDDTESLVTALAPQLSVGEQRLLTHAIEYGTPVRIQYTNAEGDASARVIEPLSVQGRVMEAWCQLREEERMFALDRIGAVAPA